MCWFIFRVYSPEKERKEKEGEIFWQGRRNFLLYFVRKFTIASHRGGERESVFCQSWSHIHWGLHWGSKSIWANEEDQPREKIIQKITNLNERTKKRGYEIGKWVYTQTFTDPKWSKAKTCENELLFGSCAHTDPWKNVTNFEYCTALIFQNHPGREGWRGSEASRRATEEAVGNAQKTFFYLQIHPKKIEIGYEFDERDHFTMASLRNIGQTGFLVPFFYDVNSRGRTMGVANPPLGGHLPSQSMANKWRTTVVISGGFFLLFRFVFQKNNDL